MTTPIDAYERSHSRRISPIFSEKRLIERDMEFVQGTGMDASSDCGMLLLAYMTEIPLSRLDDDVVVKAGSVRYTRSSTELTIAVAPPLNFCVVSG